MAHDAKLEPSRESRDSPLAAIIVADRWVSTFARQVATAGALMMLGVAIISTFDVVVMRWLLNAPIPGSNEIFLTVFPVAIACVMASGLCDRASLEIDLMSKVFSACTVRWLRAVGATVFLVVIVLLAWGVYLQAMSAWNRGSTTMIMRWPLWPWYFAIAALFILCVSAQLVVALRATAELMRRWYVATTLIFGGVGLVTWSVIAVSPMMQIVFLDNMLACAIALVALLWVMILLYVPLAAALTACASMGILGLFGSSQAVNIAGSETQGLLNSLDLAVLPFFLMMGGFAMQSGISRDIFALAQAIFRPFRGGLALAAIGGSAGFGALTGSSVATVATIGSTAYPEMVERRYSPRLSAGAISAGGTLGQLLPPSTAAVIYAVLVEQSIGALYIALIVPALLTVLFYLGSIMVTVAVSPSAAPRGSAWDAHEILTATVTSLPALFLFVLVFGGIFIGVFTATEAAGVGAVVAFSIMVVRGGLRSSGLWKVMAETTRSTSLIYFLIIGALIITFFFSSTGLSTALTKTVSGLDVPGWVIVVILCFVYIILGFVLDSIAIMMITASLSAGIVAAYGYDPIWWGVIMIVIVEIGVITPPFGLNLFMLKGVAPKLSLGQIYAGVVPFVVADIVKLILLIAFPAIILWLPGFL